MHPNRFLIIIIIVINNLFCSIGVLMCMGILCRNISYSLYFVCERPQKFTLQQWSQPLIGSRILFLLTYYQTWHFTKKKKKKRKWEEEEK